MTEPMLNVAVRAAWQAGRAISQAYGRDAMRISKVEQKSQRDYVTNIDQYCEGIIKQELEQRFSDHCIIGEESGYHGIRDSDYCWLIDPLDGTTNFIHGIPHVCISIACVHKGRLLHAVVYDPLRNETFTASRGQGARLNDQRIRVTQKHNLEHALIATGIPFRDPAIQHLDDYLRALKSVTQASSGIRRAGSAALDLAYVAAGRFDGYFELGLQPWDIAAGCLLVQEAGGLVSDMDGAESYMKTGNIVAAHNKCFRALLQLIKPALGQSKTESSNE